MIIVTANHNAPTRTSPLYSRTAATTTSNTLHRCQNWAALDRRCQQTALWWPGGLAFHKRSDPILTHTKFQKHMAFNAVLDCDRPSSAFVRLRVPFYPSILSLKSCSLAAVLLSSGFGFPLIRTFVWLVGSG
jgi:hypothetical protein